MEIDHFLGFLVQTFLPLIQPLVYAAIVNQVLPCAKHWVSRHGHSDKGISSMTPWNIPWYIPFLRILYLLKLSLLLIQW